MWLFYITNTTTVTSNIVHLERSHNAGLHVMLTPHGKINLCFYSYAKCKFYVVNQFEEN